MDADAGAGSRGGTAARRMDEAAMATAPPSRGGGPRTALALGVAAVLLATALLAISAPTAEATHAPEQTIRCAYEAGYVGTVMSFSQDDPTGLTSDGWVNIGGCFWEFEEGTTIWNDVEDGIPVAEEYTRMQASIVDDVFGNEVGGRICSDVDGDLVCGTSEHEIITSFCGTSPVFEAQVDSDGDGHLDFGHYVGVWVAGTYTQALDCDPVANPVGGTSGGLLDPAGGIYMSLLG